MLSYLRAVIDSRRANRESGASAVEYGLMVAAIAAVIVVVVFALGGVVSNIFGNSCRAISNEGNAAGQTVPAGCEAPTP